MDLKKHEEICINSLYGFNTMEFYEALHRIVKGLPNEFRYLEIGVYRGQALSVIDILARMEKKRVFRYGVAADDFYIKAIHKIFEQKNDYILYKPGDKPFGLNVDILFFETLNRDLMQDFEKYSHLVKEGGYIIISESYKGSVFDYVEQKLPENKNLELLFIVNENKVYRRV